MKMKTTKVKGLSFNVIVEEYSLTDKAGILLWYHARILTEEHKSARRQLVRKTRIPGAAINLARNVQARGLRALDFFATAA